MIEISTDNFKVFRREIALYRPGSEISEIIKDFEEYENILDDARKIAKGELIS